MFGLLFSGVMVPGVWQQTRELLTPDTAKKIIRPQLRSRQPTECGKHFVAGMMPVPIVDALKAIEIKHDLPPVSIIARLGPRPSE